MTKAEKEKKIKNTIFKLLLNNKRGCANYRAADKLTRQLRYLEQTTKNENK